MIEFEVIADTNIIEFVVEGKVTKDDLVPILEATGSFEKRQYWRWVL